MPATPPTDDSPTPRAPLVAVRGLAKTFPDGTAALRGFDLDVAPGEFVSLLGPSGCGKSTALRLIAGLATPSAGTVHLELDPAALGVVFQEPTLMPWASAFDNVWLPLRLRGIGRAEARAAVETALERVGLADAAGRAPRQLSGGMKMRVAIARALVTRPRLLLMDEPFAALDEITRFRLNNDLLRLSAELGTAVLFVTHSVYESVYLSDRIVVMASRPGRVAAELRIAGPVPRTDAFRTSPDYVEACRATSDALRRAMESEAA